MTSPDFDTLERELQSLTAGPDEAPGLWRLAMGRAAAHPGPSPLASLLTTPFSQRTLISGLAAAIVLALVVGFIVPSLGKARRATRVSGATVYSPTEASGLVRTTDSYEYQAPAPDWKSAGGIGGRDLRGRTLDGQEEGAPPAAFSPAPQGPTAQAELRQVVRKSTLELESPDIPAAFAKVAHTLSEARGEYIENSSLTGEGPSARATLTLRVAADRLSAALNDLRPLGKVIAESTTGEDVTAQAVDLDARSRNEQRIEAELLQLLEQRTDAPLKDVLELRQSLSSVRESIERLQGQRQHLSRLVSLATVLVIIRAPDRKPEPAPARSGPWDYFKTNIGASWTTGLAFLADTVAALVKVAVGGLLWWLLAAIVLMAAVRYHRRALARGV